MVFVICIDWEKANEVNFRLNNFAIKKENFTGKGMFFETTPGSSKSFF